MRRYCIILLVTAFLISCSSGQQRTGGITGDSAGNATLSTANYLQVKGDSVLLPPFDIEVSLSNRANAQLLRDKETIIVAAWFSGQPADTTSKEYAESGEMFIKTFQVVLDTGRIARFERLQFSKALYDSLGDKDIRVLINVFSGRKSSPDNLLDCDILSEKLSAVQNKKFVLTGKLILEQDSSAVQ